MCGTVTSQSAATVTTRHSGEALTGRPEEGGRGKRGTVRLVSLPVSVAASLIVTRAPVAIPHLAAPLHRKFIGGTPEQWDESASTHEDPDASMDLQPVMVAEQVGGGFILNAPHSTLHPQGPGCVHGPTARHVCGAGGGGGHTSCPTPHTTPIHATAPHHHPIPTHPHHPAP